MIIGVDGNEANVQQLVGTSVYASNLLHYFYQMTNEQTQFVIFLRNKPLSSLPKENQYFKYKVIKAKLLWSQLFLPFYLFLHRKIDVFFTPAHYAPRYCPVPSVVVIHDLAYFYFKNEFLKKDLYKLEKWTKYSVEKASQIIAVSKTTKKDLLHFYDLPDAKISVIYNGFEKKKSEEKETSFQQLLEEYKIEKQKYILYVGTLQPRKNIQLLIHAFQRFKKQHSDFKLVITGKKGWLYEEIYKTAQKTNLNEAIIFTGFVEDTALTTLYKNAFCYVLPSLYEGFGIPILEAMANNCPVISSFASSLPEIGGEACLYFDPKNEIDLYDKLILLKADLKIRAELIKQGKERVKLFSWQKCAEQTLEVIKSAK